MKHSKMKFGLLVVLLTGLLMPAGIKAQEDKKAKDIQHCKETKSAFLKTDKLMKSVFESSAGYVVFPTIGKGGMGVGGATGNGILFEKGKADGKANMKQLTIGLQAGGQVYSEIIFFENQESLDRFKAGKFEFAGQISAVAVKAGVSSDIKYRDGVLVFTQAKGGLMYEASVGGQKFSYTAY